MSPGPAVAAPGAVTPQLLGADHPHGAGGGLGNGNIAPPGYKEFASFTQIYNV
mgnify:FL=1